MLLYLIVLRKPIIDRSVLTGEDLKVEKEMSLLRALSPWLILVVVLLVINFYNPLFNLLFNSFAMPVSVIPGQIIKTRMLWNAYTWVLISTVIAFVFIRPSGKMIGDTLVKWVKRTPRPAISAAIFFAIAFIMNNSGMQNIDGGWKMTESGTNMIRVLADASSSAFGSLYPFISSYLGLLGGFVSGSEASTIAMFTKYHILTSKALHVDPLVVIAATAIGGGLASVISPAKLQNAAATIDALGIESKVIKTAFVISLFITTVSAVMALIFAW
jgi:lactate permease